MMPRANFILVFCVALTASMQGAELPASSEAPVAIKSNYSVLSPAARLGVSFSSTPKGGSAATPPTPVLSPAPVAPGTVVLSPYLVTTPRIKLTEKELLTDKGRLALAQKQHITPLYRATFGPLSQLATYYFNWPSILGGWHPNETEAMTLYRQEERLKMLDEMDSLIRLETISDPKQAKQFKHIRLKADLQSR